MLSLAGKQKERRTPTKPDHDPASQNARGVHTTPFGDQKRRVGPSPAAAAAAVAITACSLFTTKTGRPSLFAQLGKTRTYLRVREKMHCGAPCLPRPGLLHDELALSLALLERQGVPLAGPDDLHLRPFAERVHHLIKY